ncbi:hypothetical protein AB0953_28025 [Streptomyces sp. NPDC046866]|uniref:hypothetical protein n=1 Tax=Streptomyces sp. NPDC046866 TaxID=3154921 RepID=UPI00345413B2
MARDVLLQLIGHAAGQVGAGEVDADREWAEKRDRWAALLNTLDPRDADSVQAVLNREAPVLKSIREGLSR